MHNGGLVQLAKIRKIKPPKLCLPDTPELANDDTTQATTIANDDISVVIDSPSRK